MIDTSEYLCLYLFRIPRTSHEEIQHKKKGFHPRGKYTNRIKRKYYSERVECLFENSDWIIEKLDKLDCNETDNKWIITIKKEERVI